MNKFYPNSFNISLMKQKGLLNDYILTDKFLILEKKYRKYFQNYIIKMLDLTKYDTIINECNLKFYECDNNDKDYYQKESNLKYIYIKNNLHIEKLSDRDLYILETSNDDSLLNELIERTWKEIIKMDFLNGEKTPDKFKTQMFKGFDTPETILLNNSLIIVIRQKISKSEYINDDYNKNIRDKHKFMLNLINDMKLDFKGKLDYTIEIVNLMI